MDVAEIQVSKFCRKHTPDLKRPLCVEYYCLMTDGTRIGPSYISIDKKWCRPCLNADEKWYRVQPNGYRYVCGYHLTDGVSLIPLNQLVIDTLEHAITEYYLLNAHS